MFQALDEVGYVYICQQSLFLTIFIKKIKKILKMGMIDHT